MFLFQAAHSINEELKQLRQELGQNVNSTTIQRLRQQIGLMEHRILHLLTEKGSVSQLTC